MRTGNRTVGRWGSTAVVTLLVLLLLAGAVLLQYSIDDEVAGAGWDDSAPFETGRSLLDVLGGMRESLAAHLWTKTDVIFHEYLGGSLVAEKPLYPYFWMITRLDPHFTMATYYASWMLARMGKVEEGFDLALEGVRYNPYSAVLQENLASIYFYFERDPRKARYHLLKAIKLSSDPEEIEVFTTFLGIIDKVLAGEIGIPEVTPLEKVQEVHESTHECEHEHHHDGHEHDHEHQ